MTSVVEVRRPLAERTPRRLVVTYGRRMGFEGEGEMRPEAAGERAARRAKDGAVGGERAQRRQRRGSRARAHARTGERARGETDRSKRREHAHVSGQLLAKSKGEGRENGPQRAWRACRRGP